MHLTPQDRAEIAESQIRVAVGQMTTYRALARFRAYVKSQREDFEAQAKRHEAEIARFRKWGWG